MGWGWVSSRSLEMFLLIQDVYPRLSPQICPFWHIRCFPCGKVKPPWWTNPPSFWFQCIQYGIAHCMHRVGQRLPRTHPLTPWDSTLMVMACVGAQFLLHPHISSVTPNCPYVSATFLLQPSFFGCLVIVLIMTPNKFSNQRTMRMHLWTWPWPAHFPDGS